MAAGRGASLPGRHGPPRPVRGRDRPRPRARRPPGVGARPGRPGRHLSAPRTATRSSPRPASTRATCRPRSTSTWCATRPTRCAPASSWCGRPPSAPRPRSGAPARRASPRPSIWSEGEQELWPPYRRVEMSLASGRAVAVRDRAGPGHDDAALRGRGAAARPGDRRGVPPRRPSPRGASSPIRTSGGGRGRVAAPQPADHLTRSADAPARSRRREERHVTSTTAPDLRTLAVELQSLGVRTALARGPRRHPRRRRRPLRRRLHLDRRRAADRPGARRLRRALALRAGDERLRAGRHALRDGVEVGPVRLHPRPKIYDLETADGVPYWKIALMHLDSLASTVFQRCVYWGTDEQCHFCAIGTSLANGRTVPVKTPALLAEVAEAAARLDGAKDVTLTTGTPNRHDRGAPYMARCAAAIRDAERAARAGPDRAARRLRLVRRAEGQRRRGAGAAPRGCRPGGARAGRARASTPRAATTTWRPGRRRSRCSAAGQVSTYFILGLGETPESVMEGCRAAIDRGVYPFVVPLRPAPGQHPRPRRAALGRVRARGLRAGRAAAGRGRDDEPERPRRAACAARPARRSPPSSARSAAGATACRPRTGRDSEPARAGSRLEVRVARAPTRTSRPTTACAASVFVEEQGIFAGDDRDVWDDQAVKVVAALGPLVVGAVRLYPLDEAGLWKGDRLAVLRDARRLRAGGPLVRFAVDDGGRARRPAHDRPRPGAERRLLPAPRLEPRRRARRVPRRPHQQMYIPLSGAGAAFSPSGYAGRWAAEGGPGHGARAPEPRVSCRFRGVRPDLDARAAQRADPGSSSRRRRFASFFGERSASPAAPAWTRWSILNGQLAGVSVVVDRSANRSASAECVRGS